MRLESINQLEEGQKLAMPIYANGRKVLVNTGLTLNNSIIERMKQFRVARVYVEDARFDDVEISDTLDMNACDFTLKTLNNAYLALHKKKKLDEYDLIKAATMIVDYVIENKSDGLSLVPLKEQEEHVLDHSLNVAIMSASIACNMSYNYKQLVDITVGGLIHDIGRPNTREEPENHVQTGFDFFRSLGGISLLSAIVCLEHHENFDGTGYPRHQKSSSISEYTRVIRVADFYDHILHGLENDGLPIMPHQAYERVVSVSGLWLDPNVVKVFKDKLIFYPNGSTIMLSNNMKGVVLKQTANFPQRPVVRVFIEQQLLGDVDLSKVLTLFVSDIVAV